MPPLRSVTSYNSEDLAKLYCAACKVFVRDVANEILMRELSYEEGLISARLEIRFVRQLSDGRFLGADPKYNGLAYLRLWKELRHLSRMKRVDNPIGLLLSQRGKFFRPPPADQGSRKSRPWKMSSSD